MALKLPDAVRMVPLTLSGYTWFAYKQSSSIPPDSAIDEKSINLRQEAINDGKILPEQFQSAVSATPANFYETEITEIQPILDELRALDQLCSDRFIGEAPDFRGLTEALEDFNAAADTLRKTKVWSLDSSEESHSYEVATYDDQIAAVFKIASRIRSEQPNHPTPYLLIRAIRWGELRAYGSLDPHMLRAPSSQTRENLFTLERIADWPKLLETSETEMASLAGCGWLDLQRYSCLSCEKLGSPYDGVRYAMLGELNALLTRYPDLPAASLNDGTPCAGQRTREWLDQSLKLLVTRTPDVDLAHPSGRSRFIERLQFAKQCLQDGNNDVAGAILQDLTSEADRRSLEGWEPPDFVAEPFALLLDCLSGNPELGEQRRTIFLRMCQLDPRRAIAHSKRGSDGR
jgi:type VI secretion system protein ImpA